MGELAPTCLWRISDEVVVALDDRLGVPTDAYVNGSQVWLRPDGPGDEMLEWRLHPVAAFAQPDGVDTHELFNGVALALSGGLEPLAPVDLLWDGLECFPAYGDELEPAVLARRAAAVLGIEPHSYGMVDHRRIGDAWEHSAGRISIVGELFAELGRDRV